MYNDFEIWVERFESGMAIYMADEYGTPHFLMKHRNNPDLFNFLKDGKTIARIYQYKPTRNVRQQKLYHCLRYVIKVAIWVSANELAA